MAIFSPVRPLHLFLAVASIVTLLTTTACSDGGNDALGQLGVPGAGGPGVVDVAPARVDGPIAGEPVLVSSFFSLSSVGFEQAEFFLGGTANAYVNRNELRSDGRWQVQAQSTADYTTRVVVYRPTEAADFNGTVVVEWLNVSAGFDSAPDWGMLHTELIREGYIWVGVSVQKEGVDALQDGTAAALIPGAVVDDRYAPLQHPGDAFAYDIYSQVAQALRTNDALLGGLSAQRFLAVGESQSADRLMTYVNALAPIHALFDGYFIHSRLSGSAPLQGGFFDEVAIATPEIVTVRNDLATPVMMLQTETDLFVLGSWPSNQPDSEHFRLWEVAGTAHADLYTFLDNRIDVGTNPGVAAVVENANPIPGIIECPLPVNAGPQHWVAKAALASLHHWVRDGTPPPRAERLQVEGEPPAFVVDEWGNVLGGVRTPYVDAPIALLSGEGQPQVEFDPDNRNFCFLSGTTKLFDAATLGRLYSNNADYIERVNASADSAVTQGFLLKADAELIKAHAAGSELFAP